MFIQLLKSLFRTKKKTIEEVALQDGLGGNWYTLLHALQDGLINWQPMSDHSRKYSESGRIIVERQFMRSIWIDGTLMYHVVKDEEMNSKLFTAILQSSKM